MLMSNWIQNFFRPIPFVSSVLFLLTSCGGGSVVIQPLEDRTAPTEAVLQSLAGTSEPSAVEQILADIRGRRGDLMDWELFWSLLEKNPALARRLVSTHPQGLLDLDSRSCAKRDFQSYTRFLLSIRTGWEHLFGPKRVCQTALGPELTRTVFLSYASLQSTKDRPTEDLERSFAFLGEEIRREPTTDWKSTFDSQVLSEIHAQAERLLAQSSLKELTGFVTSYRELTGAIPALSVFEKSLLFDPRFIEFYQEAKGSAETILLLTELIGPRQQSDPKSYSARNVKETLEVLWKSPFREFDHNWAVAWKHYVALKHFLIKVSGPSFSQWPLIERVNYLDRLQASFEDWWLSKNFSESQLQAFLINTLEESRNTPNQLDIAWFVVRLLPTEDAEGLEPAIQALLGEARAAVDDSNLLHLDKPNQVLSARLEVHFVKTMAERKGRLEHFCQVISEGSNPRKKINLVDLEAKLKIGIEPGCFEVVGDGPSGIQADTSLSTAYDTALFFSQPRFQLQGRSLQLGIVDFSCPEDGRALTERKGEGGDLWLTSQMDIRPFAFVSAGGKDPTSGTIGLDGVLKLVEKGRESSK